MLQKSGGETFMPSNKKSCSNPNCAGCYEIAPGKFIHPPKSGEEWIAWNAAHPPKENETKPAKTKRGPKRGLGL